MDPPMWDQCGQQYFERLSQISQSSLLDISFFDETVEILRGFITEVCIFLCFSKVIFFSIYLFFLLFLFI